MALDGRWAACAATILLAMAGFGRAEEPFDYFANSWNVVGLKDYLDGSRLTPDNRLLLADGEARFYFGRESTPLGRKSIKLAAEGWMPIFSVSTSDGPVRYQFEFWATPLPSARDWKKAFDWPVEGENFLNWVRVEVHNSGAAAAEARIRVQQTRAKANTADGWTQKLPPGARCEWVARIPFRTEDPVTYRDADARLWRQRTVDYWRQVMACAAQIEVPCRKSTDALRAAHVCQLIANDHGVLQGGEGFYDEFYIRDGAYQIMQIEEAGLDEVAAKAIEAYLKAQRADGRFETQSNQFDANGQAVWALWQYARIRGDRPFLTRAYPAMVRAAEWAVRARRGAPRDSAFAGLLPAAPADGEFLWDGKHHIVGYDLWNLRGVLATADAAMLLGRADESARWRREAEQYRADIDAACRRTGLAHFPPSWEKEGTHWGNTETLWPTELFGRQDPRVAATIAHARQKQGGGFIEGTIQWLGAKDAIHPYMSAYTSMALLAKGEDEPFVEDYFWYLLHSTAAHAFPEGIFYKRRFAWSNTIPHVTGASNFAILLRHLLVHEQGDELHLLPAVPDGWLAEGQVIRIERAPTHFGPLSLLIQGKAHGVEVHYSPPVPRDAGLQAPPRRVLLHLPRSRPLTGTLTGVEVALRPEQKARWDFQRVVELYRRQAATLVRPIPGLAALPLATPLASGQCRFLDLSKVANTDPFRAPFGVPQTGKLRFSGMSVGRQCAAGVPFSILDPAANGGRALVVLHSPRGPKTIAWPWEVTITVAAKGKRLFFLGNVHGWDSHDAGTGDWGAVAEYVIHYADGEQQSVPWITGRTADEWAAPPEAEEVQVGLRGDPWHLNVLGVGLRPVAVEKVVFRDLGTPAAPLLAAITLEE